MGGFPTPEPMLSGACCTGLDLSTKNLLRYDSFLFRFDVFKDTETCPKA